MQATHRLRLSRAHRALGLLTTVPLVGWILSSFVLHGVGLALPNGLQGVYELDEGPRPGGLLTAPDLVQPDSILRLLETDGIDRLYWLRLEMLGGVPAYVAKPGPYALERTYDARTGGRLDPLPEAMLRKIADEHLVDTHVVDFVPHDEFNRYYTVDRVPAVAATMEGRQPSELVFSTASGRILRRTDPLAEAFHAAYRSVHVWQWGRSVTLFSAILYGLVGLALLLVVLGHTLWWTRREARSRWTRAVRPARRIHGRLAPLAGLLLVTQMLVGSYLWYNLGLIEPRFRGQGSFAEDWRGGISVAESLAGPVEIESALSGEGTVGWPVSPVTGKAGSHDGQQMQRFEWRAVGRARYWLAYPSRNANGVLIEAASGRVLDRLPPRIAAAAAAEAVQGVPAGPAVESSEYWMDFNARIPTYRIRFTDPDDTDVHVSQLTGEVVQRRPAIWRSFGPFLAYHTFGFTGNPWFDTVLLTTLQIAILTMVVTGWRLALRGSGESNGGSR